MKREEIEKLISDLPGVEQTEPDGTKYHIISHDDLVAFAERLSGSSGKPNTHEGIKEVVESYYVEHRHDVLLNPYNALMEFAKLICEWQKKPVEGLDEAAENAAIKEYPNEVTLDDADAEMWYKQHLKYWRSGVKKGFKAGVEWVLSQKTKLPEGLDQAADNFCERYYKDWRFNRVTKRAFKAGAEWLTGGRE